MRCSAAAEGCKAAACGRTGQVPKKGLLSAVCSIEVQANYLGIPHPGWIHDKRHADLAVEVGTQVDGRQLVELRDHIRAHIHQLKISAPASTLAVEALADGMHGGQGHLIAAHLAQHLQRGPGISAGFCTAPCVSAAVWEHHAQSDAGAVVLTINLAYVILALIDIGCCKQHPLISSVTASATAHARDLPHLLEGGEGLARLVDVGLVDFVGHEHDALSSAELQDLPLVLHRQHLACRVSGVDHHQRPHMPAL